MSYKKNQSLFKNKNLGHLIALAFYTVIIFAFYIAATNMNYVWKWNSVPKYFAYTETINVSAPIDGKLVEENGKYLVIGKDERKTLSIDNTYKFDYSVGEDVYEGDNIASKEFTKTGPILNGLWVTLKISFFAAILTLFVGVLIAFMKISSFQFLRDIASVYTTIIRGTPLLVQIFLFYFIIANIFELERIIAGILSLGIFFGAYMGEILRGAIQSIDKGQMEAASSLGISRYQAMRYIILPQAFKRALPTLIGEMISLVKDSSLVSVISITDLTKVGKEIVANTFSPFETWIVIALVYLAITSLLTYLGHRLENNLKNKGGI